MTLFSRWTAVIVMGCLGLAPDEGRATRAGTGPGSYRKLASGSGPIRIPFRTLNGKPLLDLEIDGRKAALMIDNGVLWDQVWLFGSPLVTELGLKPLQTAAIGGEGAGDPTRAFAAKPLTLAFPGIVFRDQPALVSPPAAGFANLFPGADGQLSNAFFGHFVVEFDFVGNEVVLHDPEGFRREGNGCVLEMKKNGSGTHSVPMSLTLADGTTYDDRVDVDFGGIYPLKVALNTRHAIRLPADAKERPGRPGAAPEHTGRIESMRLGPYEFRDMTAVFGDERTSRIHPDNLGVIGLPVLRKFRVVFDYFHGKLYLEPNRDFGVPFR